MPPRSGPDPLDDPRVQRATNTFTFASTPATLPGDTSKPFIDSEAMILLTGRASANCSTSSTELTNQLREVAHEAIDIMLTRARNTSPKV